MIRDSSDILERRVLLGLLLSDYYDSKDNDPPAIIELPSFRLAIDPASVTARELLLVRSANGRRHHHKSRNSVPLGRNSEINLKALRLPHAAAEQTCYFLDKLFLVCKLH